MTGREGQDGLDGLDGQDRRAVPVSPTRVGWSIVLLLIFFTVVRTLGDRTVPAGTAIDCHHVAGFDVPAFERCLELRPNAIELMTDLGTAHEHAGQWDRAESVYRRALAIDAEDGDVRVRLGNVLLRRGDAAAARREAVAALALQPGRAPALDLLARADAAADAGRNR